MKKSFYESIFCDPLLDPEWKEALAGAYVVKADNVYEYFSEQIHGNEWKGSEKTIPLVAPIFPKYFVEFTNGDNNFGVLFKEKIDRAYCEKMDCEWHMEADLFIGNKFHDPYMYKTVKFHIPLTKSIFYFVDKTGRYRLFDEAGNDVSEKMIMKTSKELCDIDELSYPFFVGLLTTSFCHCKNVVDLEHGGKKPGMSRRRNRSTPKYKYHVLKIEPMKKILRTEGNIEENGLMKALHICRGHFKDYRDKGLFGKHKDIYWWDAHVKGSIAGGIVDKDYRIGEVRDGD